MNRLSKFIWLLSILCSGAFAQAKTCSLNGKRTIGPGGDYPNIATAYADVMQLGLNGDLVLELLAGYTSTSESLPITFGFFNSAWGTEVLTIRPAAGVSNINITASSSGFLFSFIGCMNIVIDGRAGGTGNSSNLTITNTANSGSVARFASGACFNALKYLTLKAQNTNLTTGMVTFGAAVPPGGRGNDSNLIDHCIFMSPSSTAHAVNMIYSAGSTNPNIHNRITNNEFVNFWNPSGECNGIRLSVYNTEWEITGNSFYQTYTRTPTAALAYNNIQIVSTIGTGFIVDNNYFGGSAPQCGGSPLSISSTAGLKYTGLYLICDSGIWSSFKGNRVANINISQSGTGTAGYFYGVNTVQSWLDISGNTFGDMNVPVSIELTYGGSSGLSMINSNGNGPIDLHITNNSFGGINLKAASANASIAANLIAVSDLALNYPHFPTIIRNNTIGSTIPDNIQISTNTASTKLLTLNGIFTTSSLNISSIQGNIIRNLRNKSQGMPGGGTCYVHGIHSDAGTDTILFNQIYNLTSDATVQTDDTVNTSVAGIVHIGNGNSHLICDNQIYNLKQTHPDGVHAVSGIVCKVLGALVTVERNRISNLESFSTSGTLNGIFFSLYPERFGRAECNHNMISLGMDVGGSTITTPLTIYGIRKYKGNLKVTFNTVYIGGNNVGFGTGNTYAHHFIVSSKDTVYNNLFVNNRSNAVSGGSHYAEVLLTLPVHKQDYNHFYCNGNGGILSHFAGNDGASMSTWQGMTGLDVHGHTGPVEFIKPMGVATQIDLHLNAISAGKGDPNYSYPVDLDGDQRSTPPETGADEIPADLQLYAIDSPGVSFCGNTKNIYVRLRNTGLLKVSKARIQCYVNDTLRISTPWSGSLDPGSTSPAILAGSYVFVSGSYKLTVKVDKPDGLTDFNNTNDSLILNLQVTKTLQPEVSNIASLSGLCPGMPTWFKAKVTAAGSSPVFQWKLNNVPVGSNSDSFYLANPAHQDSVFVIYTPSYACPAVPVLISNTVKLTIASPIEPDLVLTSTDTTICAGKAVDFYATQSNCGLTPHYTWFRNGNPIGSDSPGYRLVTPVQDDVIKCVVGSSLPCASKPYDTSNAIKVNVNPILVPSAALSVEKTSACYGTPVSFYASAVNPGTKPFYQWRLKSTGLLIGTDNDTIQYNSLDPGDSVYLVLTSNAPCATPVIIASNPVSLNIIPLATPQVTLNADKRSICSGDSVSFSLQGSGGGSNPTREWYRNNTLVQTGGDLFKTGSINNLDSFYVKYISNATCLSKPFALSNKQYISVFPYVIPDVTISASSINICSGTEVKYMANPVNGGFAPHYLWKKNNVVMGDDAPVFITNALANNDSISVILTTSATCPTKQRDTSSKIIMRVNPVNLPVATISTPSTSFCNGNLVSFGSNIVNGGTAPVYTWMRNGVQVGGNFATYQASDLQDKDTVYLHVNSNIACSINPAVSNRLLMLKVPSLPASVSITSTAKEICAGTSVTFSTTVANAGDTPHFQWKVHGANAGTNSPFYTTAGLNDKDSVSVEMTSSIPCAIPAPAISNSIGMVVHESFTPAVSITNSADTICNGAVVTFTATDVNGGILPVHQWLKNDFPAGSNSPVLTTNVLSTDIIKCIMTPDLNCPTKAKDTATAKLQFLPAPQKPKVTRSRDTLYSTVGPAYQWYVNTSELSGETKRYLVVYHNGSFKVGIDSAGCRTLSNPYNVTHFVGVRELLSKSDMLVFPNPGTGAFSVQLEHAADAEAALLITDAQGRILIDQLARLDQEGRLSIDLRAYDDGLYFLRMRVSGLESDIVLIKMQ